MWKLDSVSDLYQATPLPALFRSKFIFMFMSMIQRDSEEYQAACKLWEVYLQTRNEFVQPGDGDEDDEDGDDMMDTPGMSTEDEVLVSDITNWLYY